MPIAYAHGPQAGHEFFDRGSHMREIGTGVRDVINVKEPRAGDMGGVILGLRITPGVGQIPRGIKDAQVWVFQVLSQPVG